MKGETIPALVDVEVRLDFLDLSPVAADDNGASIPIRFMEDETQRVAIYRKIAAIASQKELDALRSELRDRCGRLPKSVERLLAIASLRLAASKKGISRVETKEDKVLLSRRNDFIMPNGKYPRLTATKPDAKIAELAALLKGI
jgi:transcription-repair coupling factor (superfamily II helicase)